MVGNFDVDVEQQQRIGHLLSPLPPEMRDFIEQYVGPMVLKPDGEIVRREAETPAETNTAPAKAEAVKRSISRNR